MQVLDSIHVANNVGKRTQLPIDKEFLWLFL